LPSKYEALLEYRRSLPGAPRLTRRDVTARGLRFAVFCTPEVSRNAGAGPPPLVCVNGGMLYSHAMLWPALAPLATGRQLVFYDQRGRGESEEPSDPLSARIEHDVEDLFALREALGFREWDVLGHSWGAGIALLAAERDREGVRRLVLVDPVGATSDWISGLHERALERLSTADRPALERIDPRSLVEPDPALHSAYSRAIYPAWFTDPRLARAFTLPRALSRTGAAVLARLRREGYSWTRLARAVRAPTLVLHGDRDLILCATSHELTSLVVSARLELVPECGHMPFWEAPETFFTLVSAFVATP
jgi:proline iminopeptidase